MGTTYPTQGTEVTSGKFRIVVNDTIGGVEFQVFPNSSASRDSGGLEKPIFRTTMTKDDVDALITAIQTVVV